MDLESATSAAPYLNVDGGRTVSNEITRAIWKLRGIPPTTKFVLISLGDQASTDGRCWPSVRYTAERTGLSERTVQSAIAWLIEAGLVTRKMRHGRSSMFGVHPAGFAPCSNDGHATEDRQAGKALTQPQQAAHPAPATASPITPIEPSGNPQTATQPASTVTQESVRTAARPGPKSPSSKTYSTWCRYAEAYRERYGAWPVWNSKTAGQISHLIDRLGAEEAPPVAAFYTAINDARILNNCHSLNDLLARAESYRTQWATGQQMNATTARQIEATQANLNAAQAAGRILLEGDENAFL